MVLSWHVHICKILGAQRTTVHAGRALDHFWSYTSLKYFLAMVLQISQSRSSLGIYRPGGRGIQIALLLLGC